MSSSLENFYPRLRPGRVIPQGSRIIFETDAPYNQIVLPIALADLVLLCSGQFSMREIVEKIYRKKGSVPFKSILKAMHALHQGGFFENGEELELNSHLNAWMETKRRVFDISLPLMQRLIAERASPILYYAVTLALIVTALFGLQYFLTSPFMAMETWFVDSPTWEVLLKVWVASSILQTLRYTLRAIQLLLLTGKAYNVSLHLNLWGIYIHVGDEANDLFENRLYMTMFHVSQILAGWTALFCLHPFVDQSWREVLALVNVLIMYWETNPFLKSDGLKLVQSLFVNVENEIASWHFETDSILNPKALNIDRQDAGLNQITSIWGALWLVFGFASLHAVAVAFGPVLLNDALQFDLSSVFPTIGIVSWLVALFFVVQTLIESLFVSLFKPLTKKTKTLLRSVRKTNVPEFSPEEILSKIQDLPLFSHFHEQILSRIVEKSQIQSFTGGTAIVSQGSPSREVFVLLHGEVHISRLIGGQLESIVELGPVSVFGEAALLDDSPRAAEVVARDSNVVVLRVPVAFLRQVAEESQVVRHLNDFRNAILVNQFFSSSPIFRSLSRESIDFLSSRGALQYNDGQHTVFRQGDVGDSIYFILRGSVIVEVHGHQVKRLAQGNFFGEISLIANIPRTGTILTAEPCVFFRISAESFWEVLIQHMDLGVFIESLSERRLSEDLDITTIKKAGSDS